jgi:hypothetical protein
MANVDYTSTQAVQPSYGDQKTYIMKNTLDFSDTNAASADVCYALYIPAETFVEKVWTKLITAEGATATPDLGDTTTHDGWNTAVDLNTTALTVEFSISGTDAYATTAGKHYAAATTINFTANQAYDAAVVEVFALCYDLS